MVFAKFVGNEILTFNLYRSIVVTRRFPMQTETYYRQVTLQNAR